MRPMGLGGLAWKMLAETAPDGHLAVRIVGAMLRGYMTGLGFAVFVLVSFLVPVPILTWLDRGRRQPGSE